MNILRVQSSTFSNAYKPQLKPACPIKPLGADTVTFGSNADPKHVSNIAKIQKYPVKVVFSDLDGTILYDHKPSEGSLEAIESLKEAGIPLVLTTGRSRKEVQPVLELLGIDRPDYLITEQGAIIFDKDGNEIFNDTMSKKDARRTIKCAEKYAKIDENIRLLFYIGGKVYATSNITGGEAHMTNPIVKESYDEILAMGNPTRITFVKLDSEKAEDLNGLLNFVNKKLKWHGLNAFESGSVYNCEVMKKSTTKGNAAKEVAKRMGVSLKNAAALGDASNDVKMIETIGKFKGLSVAMGNATEELKNKARMITDDVQERGFAKAIQAMLNMNDKYAN